MPVLLLSALALLGCNGSKVDCDEFGLDIPSVRGEVSAGFDAELDRMVFFGGNDSVPVNCASGATNFPTETWEYNRTCNAFRQLDPQDEPSPRGRHASAFDEDNLYISYGRFRAQPAGDYTLRRDVWAFNYEANDWTRLSAGEGPAARSNHSMVLIKNKLWFFGGSTSTNGLAFVPQNDVWTFDLETETWEEISTTGGPEARLFHSAATDGEMMYIYGGGDENAFFSPTFFGDLWALDTETNEWTVMNDREPGSGPVPFDRFWANMEYDTLTNSLILFGGHDSTSLGNTNQIYRYDLSEGRWYSVLDGDTANQPSNGQCDFPADFVNVDSDSPERREAGASLMTPDGEMLIFGGKTDCGLINDVWGYDATTETWTEHSPATSGEVCPRSNGNCTSICG